jgi:DNA-binding response OmpR family regulator
MFKTYPESAAIPVVISSVLKEDDLARALGAADVLPRPFNAAQLVAKLKSVIAAANPHPGSPV